MAIGTVLRDPDNLWPTKHWPTKSIFSLFTHNPQLKCPKWKHSDLNYPIRTKEPLPKKRDKRGKKMHSNHVGSGFATTKYCMWKGNGRQANQKYRPGALVLCGQWERVGFSTTYRPPGNRQTQFNCWSGEEKEKLNFFDMNGSLLYFK